ncbi:MAG TPA: HEAT repeat domain-containing protein [Candidatus Saccharimonadales bacterium]|nr:HEAT repeat domain-containing protein [Candidatus Saccharimonadales bacterium]
MSVALIQETAKEVRRLAIAGSPLAVGDFRLKKLIGPLEQAGAKVPVFAQVAKAIGDLVNGTEAASAALLLNLSTLVNAILYTQGESGTQAKLEEMETYSASSCSTKTSARVLKPIVEALTNSGGGRFEVVKSAVERGVFNDLRLIEPALRALDDNYAEMADLVAEKILPAYGPGITPLLKGKLDLKGKKSDARRLAVLHRLDPEGSATICKQAVDDGSADLKVAAINCLSGNEKNVPLLLEQGKAKNKAVRETALDALAAYEHPDIAKLFRAMIQGKPEDMMAGPLSRVKSSETFQLLLLETQEALAKALKAEPGPVMRCTGLLHAFQGRKDPDTERLLISAISEAGKLAKIKASKECTISGSDINRQLAHLLYGLSSPRALDAILAQREALPADGFGLVLRSALRSWPAAKVYEEFSPLLEQKKGGGKEKSEELQRIIWVACLGDSMDIYYAGNFEPESGRDSALRKIEWDPRWLDQAIKLNLQTMVCCLARSGHKAAVTYLLKVLESKKETYPGLIIQALVRCQYPKATDAFMEVVARKTKKALYYDYELQTLFRSAQHLSPADLPKLDTFAGTLDEKFIDKFLEALEPLRSTKQTS